MISSNTRHRDLSSALLGEVPQEGHDPSAQGLNGLGDFAGRKGPQGWEAGNSRGAKSVLCLPLVPTPHYISKMQKGCHP